MFVSWGLRGIPILAIFSTRLKWFQVFEGYIDFPSFLLVGVNVVHIISRYIYWLHPFRGLGGMFEATVSGRGNIGWAFAFGVAGGVSEAQASSDNAPLTDQINNARFLREQQDNTSTPTEGKEKKRTSNRAPQ